MSGNAAHALNAKIGNFIINQRSTHNNPSRGDNSPAIKDIIISSFDLLDINLLSASMRIIVPHIAAYKYPIDRAQIVPLSIVAKVK